jgi:hypothetical protein
MFDLVSGSHEFFCEALPGKTVMTAQYRVPADYSITIEQFSVFWMPAPTLHNLFA